MSNAFKESMTVSERAGRASACEYKAEGRDRDNKAERSKRERGHMLTFARSSHHAAVAIAQHRRRAGHLWVML